MKARPVRIVGQRKDMDCGVAALATLLHKPYGDVAALVRRMYPVFPKRGLGIYHLEALAAKLGTPLRRVYRRKDCGHLVEHTLGILGVMGEGVSWAGHWVVLKENVIIDPDDEHIYGVEEYLQSQRVRACTLLVPKKTP